MKWVAEGSGDTIMCVGNIDGSYGKYSVNSYKFGCYFDTKNTEEQIIIGRGTEIGANGDSQNSFYERSGYKGSKNTRPVLFRGTKITELNQFEITDICVF